MNPAENQADEKEREAAGALVFGRFGLAAAAVVLAVSVWWAQAALALLASAWLAVGLACRTWSRLAPVRLTCSRTLSRTRAFPGEELELTYLLDNAKLLPLTWLEITDRLDPGLTRPPEGPLAAPGAEPGSLRLTAALGWYSALTWTGRLGCARRGWFDLGPARLSCGDPLGLIPRTSQTAPAQEVIVYPRLLDLPTDLAPSRHALGEEPTRFSLHRDPVLTVGLNRYDPQTPFKHIHWKASARHQELLARVFEPASRLEVMLLLEGSGFETGGEDFELAASLTASLARDFLGRGRPVGLASNAPFRGADRLTVLRPGGGQGQLISILETLAGLEADPRLQPGQLLDPGRIKAPPGAAWLLICGPRAEGLAPGLDHLARRSIRPRIIQAAQGQAAAGLDGAVRFSGRSGPLPREAA